MAALSSLFRELKNSNVVEHNPVDGIKRPPSIVKKERLGFTDQEVNRILDFHSAETVQGLNNQAILRFLFFTGCRISEALHVKVDDIEEREGVKVVHIRGKGEKLRIIPLNPKLAKTLQELIEQRRKGKGNYLFTRVQLDQNKPMAGHGVQVLLKKTLQKLNLPLSASIPRGERSFQIY